MRTNPTSIRIPKKLQGEIDAALEKSSGASKHQFIITLIEQGLQYPQQQLRLSRAKKTRQDLNKCDQSIHIINNNKRILRKRFTASLFLNVVSLISIVII